MNNEEMKEFTELTPFKLQVLQSFPYIDADFDALTNYELLCKVVDYLNTTITNVNNLNDNFVTLYQQFVALKNYIDNYFDNLDVQEEINNKLDAMAESGELTTLIKNYVDPIFDDYSSQMNNEYDLFTSQVNGQLDFMNDKVNNIESGDPIPVASTSDMTDTTKIYLNTTDGKWYYYNGSIWTAGGDYLTSELSGYSLRGIFKNRIYPDDHVLATGGWSASTGDGTSNNTRFKNYVYIRNCCVIKNPDSNYTLLLHKYTVDNTVTYTHIANDTLEITDNNYHYLNFQNADYFRVIVVDAGGNTIPSANYKTIFDNIEFYVLDKDNIVPEELIGGGISAITDTSNAGKILRKTDAYNLSHYTMKPIQAVKDTIVDIKIKETKTKQNANFGLNIYIYNSSKYVVQSITSVHDSISVLLKEGYYLAIVGYGANDTKYNRFDINDYLEVITRNPAVDTTNKYKIPLLAQHQRILNYDYGSGLTAQGFTSDDNYFYVSGLVNGQDNHVKIFKIDISDTTDITISDEREYGHANGLAKVGDQIAITHMSQGVISFIDASDLSDEGTANAITQLASNGYKLGSVSSLAYNSTYNTYCLWGPKYREGEDPTITNPTYLPKHFVITDSNFNIIKDIEVTSPRNVTSSISGGCYLFDNMIALSVYENGTNTNKVLFYNWHGDLITYIDTPFTTEIEGITCVGDIYYMLFNNSYQGFAIYELKTMAFRYLKNDDIINDFVSSTTSIFSDIGIATNQYNHLYNEITDTAGTTNAVDWF